MNKNIEQTINDIHNGKKKTIWFDIDGTLTSTLDGHYELAEPDEAMITLLNMLYDKGCEIYIFTARGASSGTNWRDITKKQLEKWGIQYHKLIVGYRKDLYIGDETMTPEEFLNEV